MKKFLIISLIAWLFFGQQVIFAKQNPDQYSINRMGYLQYQMWSLSRNYRFGTTLGQNSVNALAWQYAYLASLPAAYPGKSTLLKPYQSDLTKQKITEAKDLSKHLRHKYGLNFRLDDKQLSDMIFASKEKHSDESNEETKSLSFKQLITDLNVNKRKKLANNLLQRLQALLADKDYPIVFGQVVVNGAEPAQMVNSPVKLLSQGLFVDYAMTSQLTFSLPGYQSKTVKLDSNKEVQSLGQIHLDPSNERKKTGFVGSVLPWYGVDKGNIILKVAGQKNDEDNPWYHPVIPITLLNSGKFYATGLTPGMYELIIQIKDLKVSHKFSIQKGHIKGLALIDLRSKV